MNQEQIKYHIRGLLEAIGENPDREGLKETPDRVARMLSEVLAGTAYSNHEIAQMFSKTFELTTTENDPIDSAVVVKDIQVFSYCEHHMALMYDMHVNVAYLPKERVLGLSKIARICDMAARRLQLQERLGKDIAEIVSEAAGSPDVGVMITGCHSCMTARGIRNTSAKTVTKTFMGEFRTDKHLQELIL